MMHSNANAQVIMKDIEVMSRLREDTYSRDQDEQALAFLAFIFY